MATVLVTGSEGFIGTKVCDRLRLLHPRYHTLLRNDCLDKRVHPDLTRFYEDTTLNRRPYWDIPQDVLDEADVVIHLAAQVGVADSMRDPMRYIQQNTRDTASFLHRLSRTKVRRLVIASTLHDPAEPPSVYHLTKFDQEQLALLWGQQHRRDVTALRIASVYGPGQTRGVFTHFAAALATGQRPAVFEDGQQTRDFIHVDDVADLLVRAAMDRRPRRGRYDVCTGQATTLQRAAELFVQHLDADVTPQITGAYRAGDMRDQRGDPRRTRAEFPEWSPRPFAVGIAEYAGWLRQVSQYA